MIITQEEEQAEEKEDFLAILCDEFALLSELLLFCWEIFKGNCKSK